MLMSVGTEVTFDAAHCLSGHPKCGSMHGHTWRVGVNYRNITMHAVAGRDMPPSGMFVDFGKIKQLIKDQFDHGTLNSFMSMPTAENIAWYILRLMPEIWGRCYTLEVTVWESPVSYAQASMVFDFLSNNGGDHDQAT